MTCAWGKRIGLCCLIAAFCLAFLALPGLPLRAESGSHASADVSITVNPIYGNYRYSLDIVFYSMKFSYCLHSTARNEKTGETYVNSGEWQMEEQAMDSVTLSVVNHSDTPVRVMAKVEVSDFVRCGISIERSGLSGEYLPACRLMTDGEPPLVSTGEMTLTLAGYPELTTYSGVKTIYATVLVVPADGVATSGEPFIPFA